MKNEFRAAQAVFLQKIEEKDKVMQEKNEGQLLEYFTCFHINMHEK